MNGQRKTGALLGYANIIAKNLVNIIYVPLLLHFIGQADYGVFQMTNSVVFALTLLSAGFYGSYVRFYMREKTRDNELGILIGGTALTINVRSFFSGGLTASELVLARELMGIMTVNVAIQLLSTPFDSYIVSHEKFVFQQSRQLLTSIALAGHGGGRRRLCAADHH